MGTKQDYKILQDSELLTLIKGEDRLAFVEVYERYWRPLFRHSLAMLQDGDEAKDVVQDILIMLWEKRDDLLIHTTLSSYLYSATRHNILKRFRHAKIAESYFSKLQYALEKGSYSTDEYLDEKELAKKIETELELLPPKMREVFQLSRADEYSYREISEKLHISENTVKKQISNALKILRNRIATVILLLF